MKQIKISHAELHEIITGINSLIFVEGLKTLFIFNVKIVIIEINSSNSFVEIKSKHQFNEWFYHEYPSMKVS